MPRVRQHFGHTRIIESDGKYSACDLSPKSYGYKLTKAAATSEVALYRVTSATCLKRLHAKPTNSVSATTDVHRHLLTHQQRRQPRHRTDATTGRTGDVRASDRRKTQMAASECVTTERPGVTDTRKGWFRGLSGVFGSRPRSAVQSVKHGIFNVLASSGVT